MLTTLRDHCWRIDLGNVNAYLVDDVADPDVAAPSAPAAGRDDSDDSDDSDDRPGTLTLVDAGTPTDADTVVRAVREAGFDIAGIERVLITHYDVDHVGGLSPLVDRGLDATVYAGAPDADYLAGRATVPVGFPRGLMSRLTGLVVRSPRLPVTSVVDGDPIGSFTVYATPGHTEGHVAYVSEALSVGFVGDLVQETDSRLEPSPWFLSADADAVNESIHDFADRSPAVEVLAPGHGVPFLRNGSVRVAKLGERIE